MFLISLLQEIRLRLHNLMSDKNIMSVFSFAMPYSLRYWFILPADAIFKELQFMVLNVRLFTGDLAFHIMQINIISTFKWKRTRSTGPLLQAPIPVPVAQNRMYFFLSFFPLIFFCPFMDI
jgi:hypothetical protein